MPPIAEAAQSAATLNEAQSEREALRSKLTSAHGEMSRLNGEVEHLRTHIGNMEQSKF